MSYAFFWVNYSHISAYEDGTDTVFRDAGI